MSQISFRSVGGKPTSTMSCATIVWLREFSEPTDLEADETADPDGTWSLRREHFIELLQAWILGAPPRGARLRPPSSITLEAF